MCALSSAALEFYYSLSLHVMLVVLAGRSLRLREPSHSRRMHA